MYQYIFSLHNDTPSYIMLQESYVIDVLFFHVLIEELFQLLTRNPQYAARHHSFNCSL